MVRDVFRTGGMGRGLVRREEKASSSHLGKRAMGLGLEVGLLGRPKHLLGAFCSWRTQLLGLTLLASVWSQVQLFLLGGSSPLPTGSPSQRTHGPTKQGLGIPSGTSLPYFSALS